MTEVELKKGLRVKVLAGTWKDRSARVVDTFEGYNGKNRPAPLLATIKLEDVHSQIVVKVTDIIAIPEEEK